MGDGTFAMIRLRQEGVRDFATGRSNGWGTGKGQGKGCLESAARECGWLPAGISFARGSLSYKQEHGANANRGFLFAFAPWCVFGVPTLLFLRYRMRRTD